MNHIYRVIWNAQNACWQAVSELARGKTKSTTTSTSRTRLLTSTISLGSLFAVNLLAASVAIAGPTGGVVSAGTATINTSGATTTINQSTAKAAIDWSSFSTGSTETVNFVQPGASSITLNRVTGTSASTLNGKLNANGQVFIINPNGVLFGTTSQVNTGGLVASTLNLSNTDFLNNNFNFASATNNKTVENRGKITVPTGGTVALIAPSIKHTGTITTPEGSTLLAAGSDVTLNLNNGSLVGYTINQGKAQALINAGGMIKADGGKVILTTKGVDELSNAVVNSVGIIEAKTVSSKRGVIELGSDMVSGTVNVSGTLNASAPVSGNGGLIKTSASNVQVNAGANITTQRTNQSALPPTTSGWEVTANTVDVDLFNGISSTALSNALDKGNVTLKAVGTEPEQGNININDATSWSANTALTLSAGKDINFNNEMTLSGDKAKLAMNYDAVNGHDYNLGEGARINITGVLPTLLINGTAYTVINELGEEGDASVTTLQGMKNNLTGNYALGSDIDASDTVNWNEGKGFESIGQVEVEISSAEPSSGTPFMGKFHGLGHTIDNLNINKATPLDTSIDETVATPEGLFSMSWGDLRDVGIINANIQGNAFVGSLSGYHLEGNIKNAYSSGQVFGKAYVGGLIGIAGNDYDGISHTGKISNSHSSTQVKGATLVGGLVGNSIMSIYDSSAIGSISLPEFTMSSSDEQNLDPDQTGGFFGGGLVGLGRGIYNSYATGNVLQGAFVNGNWHEELGFYGAGGLAGAIGVNNTTDYVGNSYATGNVAGIRGVGGLAGITVVRNNYAPQLMIKNSHATGNIVGQEDVGGLVGGNAPGNIIDTSYATGTVTSITNVGGLVGNNNGGVISNSYSTSAITGNTNVGGLIGNNGEYYSSTVQNSYSSGSVSGVTNTGGLIGLQGVSSTVTDSYWNTETSGQLTSAGGTGKTTAELQQLSTFNGWDIADISDPTSTSIWVIDENNDTPRLRQNP
ncbi:MAG: filamentous hemagglutinin N-terminal domain-containing protein [Moraxellaceae bacterium]|nr:MAG: filamentous hemagglutinin N-terminal domain-containing protein [Moraxellaceae bacterium]